MCPEAADQDGERSRGQDLGGVAEVTWFAQLREERLRGDLIAAYSFLKGGRRWAGADLLSPVTSNGTQGDGMKLHQRRSDWT